MINTTIDLTDTYGRRTRYTLKLTLANSYAEFVPDQSFTFTSREVLSHNRMDSTVFKGELVDRTGVPYPKPVVCKLARGDTSSLAEEARLYTTTLQSMQGKAIPTFIFYCTGTAPDSDVPVAALFTAYSGIRLGGEWLDHPVTFR